MYIYIYYLHMYVYIYIHMFEFPNQKGSILGMISPESIMCGLPVQPGAVYPKNLKDLT